MSEEHCPTCKHGSLDKVIKHGVAVVKEFSCGHKVITVVLEEKIELRGSVKVRLKDKEGKELLESKIEGKTEKRISRKPSGAVWLVYENGEIVHIHCKVCGNEWKKGRAPDLHQKFDVNKDEKGILTIKCKKCSRTYLSG